MKKVMLGVFLLAIVSSGCKKAMDKIESQSTKTSESVTPPSQGPYSGGGNPTFTGAAQGVRGASNRTVTLNELKQLHLFMNTAYSASGQVPNSQVTYDTVYKEDPKLYNLIKDGAVVLVPMPTPEGLWAYVSEAPTSGGFVVTLQGVERKTPPEVQALLK